MANASKFKPEHYVTHEALDHAVRAAIRLGQPLLITGEPGTGKTRLADRVAFDLHQKKGSDFAPAPLVFNTKTTSTARDLFYTYDALAHFQAANLRREENEVVPRTANFIELQALGKAIAQSDPAAVDQSKFNTPLDPKPQSSVVLIDEIDKAPRDFTNDILFEIENYSFNIKEQANYPVNRSPERQIVVLMTSNSERNLPDAFLRRCLFYHIPFPSPELLREIVQIHLSTHTTFTEDLLKSLIDKFFSVRERAVRKPPATAELIAWLRMLEAENYGALNNEQQRQQLLLNLSILVKTKDDLEAVRSIF